MQQVRIGLAGCGLFGESHAQALRALPGAALNAVYDLDRPRAEGFAKSYGGRVCGSLEELCGDSEIDAVDVVTPEGAHLEPVLAALRHGKAVFVEKPLATDLGDCAAMIHEAELPGRILMVGQILRFEIRALVLRDQIASGRLGKIVSMHARRNRPNSLVRIYGRTHPAIENSIHDIDLMLWFTGDRVKRVRGYHRNATGAPHADTFWGVIEFVGGAIGVVETIWLLPDACGVRLDDALQVIGDRGTAQASLFPGGLSLWGDAGFDVPDIGYDPRAGGAAYGALREELMYFCECVRHGRQPAVITAREGKNAVRVALALVESAGQDREIGIEEWD